MTRPHDIATRYNTILKKYVRVLISLNRTRIHTRLVIKLIETFSANSGSINIRAFACVFAGKVLPYYIYQIYIYIYRIEYGAYYVVTYKVHSIFAYHPEKRYSSNSFGRLTLSFLVEYRENVLCDKYKSRRAPCFNAVLPSTAMVSQRLAQYHGTRRRYTTPKQ